MDVSKQLLGTKCEGSTSVHGEFGDSPCLQQCAARLLGAQASAHPRDRPSGRESRELHAQRTVEPKTGGEQLVTHTRASEKQSPRCGGFAPVVKEEQNYCFTASLSRGACNQAVVFPHLENVLSSPSYRTQGPHENRGRHLSYTFSRSPRLRCEGSFCHTSRLQRRHEPGATGKA